MGWGQGSGTLWDGVARSGEWDGEQGCYSSQHLREKLSSLLSPLPAIPAPFCNLVKMAAFHNSVWDLRVFTLSVWGVLL